MIGQEWNWFGQKAAFRDEPPGSFVARFVLFRSGLLFFFQSVQSLQGFSVTLSELGLEVKTTFDKFWRGLSEKEASVSFNYRTIDHEASSSPCKPVPNPFTPKYKG